MDPAQLNALRGEIIAERHAARRALQRLDLIHEILQRDSETQNGPNASAFGRPAGEAIRPTGPEGPHTGGSCHASRESVEAKDADLLAKVRDEVWLFSIGEADSFEAMQKINALIGVQTRRGIEPAAPLKREPTIGAGVVRYACSKAAKVGDRVKVRNGIAGLPTYEVIDVMPEGYCELRRDVKHTTVLHATQLEFVPEPYMSKADGPCDWAKDPTKPLRYLSGQVIEVNDRVRYANATPRTEACTYRVTKVDHAAGFVEIASDDFSYVTSVLPTALRFVPNVKSQAERDAEAVRNAPAGSVVKVDDAEAVTRPAEQSPVLYEGGIEAREGDTVNVLFAGKRRDMKVFAVDRQDGTVGIGGISIPTAWKRAAVCTLVSRAKPKSQNETNAELPTIKPHEWAEKLAGPANVGSVLGNLTAKAEEGTGGTPLGTASETGHAAAETASIRPEVEGIPLDRVLSAAAEGRNAKELVRNAVVLQVFAADRHETSEAGDAY